MKRISMALMLAGLLSASFGARGLIAETKPRDMIHAYRVWQLTEVLDLSDEEMPVFFSHLKDLDEKEAELVKEEQRGVRRIGELLEDKDVREEDLKRELDRYEETRAKLLGEIGSLRKETLSMLDTRQRCEYVVFEHRFRAELRDIISRVREQRSGRLDEAGRQGFGDDFGAPDPGGRGAGGGTPGGSGKGRR